MLFPYGGYAQSWESEYQQLMNLYQNQQFNQAFSLGQQGLARLKQEEGVQNQHYARQLRLMVLICYSAGIYEQGQEYAQQEVALRKLLKIQNLKPYAEALFNLALLKLSTQEASAAAHLLEQSEALYTESSDTTSTLTHIQLYLAEAYLQSHEYRKVENLLSELSQSLAAEQPSGADLGLVWYLKYKLSEATEEEPDTHALYKAVSFFEQSEENKYLEFKGAALQVLASVYQQREDFERAIDLYQTLNHLYEEKQLTDSLQWASILNNLGRLSLKVKPEEARRWLQKAYEINSNKLKPEDARLWASIDNYAMSLYEQGKTDQALQLYQTHKEQAQDTITLMSQAFASALNNHALLLRDAGYSSSAIQSLHQAEKVLRSITLKTKNEQLKIATLYYNLARTYQHLTQYDTAIYYYKRSTEISKLANANISSEYLAAITGMAALYQDIGFFTESEIFYNEALRIQKELGGTETNVYASILSNYALLYQEKGDYTKAKEVFDEARTIKRKLLGLDHPEYIMVLANMGLLYLEQANFEQARRMLETVLIKNENLYGSTHPQVAQSLTNLARLEIAVGAYPEAEPLLKQALQIQRTVYGEQHSAYAITAIEMANFYMQLGNYEAAEPLLLHSRDILQKSYGTYHPDYATATQNLAVLFEVKGNKEMAEKYLLETLDIDQHTLGKQHPSYAIALSNLASFYQKNDSLAQAMPLLEEAILICQNVLGKEHPLYSSTLLNLALLYQDMGEYNKAAPLIDEVVTLRKKLLGAQHPDYAYALYGKAVNSYRLNRYEEVETIFKEVIELYTWQLKEYFPALSEKEKSAFYQRIEPVLNAYRDFAMNMNLQENELSEQVHQELLANLYDLQLITKAMLLDASSRIRRSIFQRGDEKLIEVYEQWLLLKEQLAKYYTLSTQELQSRKLNLKKIEAEANELEKKLSAGSQLFASSLESRELSWRDVQQQLKENEAAVEILRISKEEEGLIFYIALIIEPQALSPRLVVLPDGLAMETKNYNYYKNAIEFRIEDELSYALYWKAIADALAPHIETVYVAPDGIYNKISLISLYNLETKTFLLDEINLRMLSSTRELTENDPAQTSTTKITEAFLLGYPDYQLRVLDQTVASGQGEENFMADIGTALASHQQVIGGKESYELHPLPGTMLEVNSIEKMMQGENWRVKKLLGSGAREETLKQLVMPNVLHIATHGYFLSDLPIESDLRAYGIHMQNIGANPLLRSGLLLAGAASTLHHNDSMNLITEDGVLTAYEAMNLNLSGTDLVVLSACETGLGEVKNGEGVYGLQRAFLVAGAKSVLMSLWKVNDESTTELITLFYENWLSGQRKSVALLNAQRSMREKYEEPYHWAAFVMIGR
ncbi:CHAT domain-containing protein [Catalinimonas niigatensis]|uniref:CHAT domain-containing protein n=1 Tax=Catalinimonas niigatensis TaxID=1397264 RepID=UPI0026662B2B|nr:CHAT domain-containing protein [Catalinimonas niigatensis]WPP52210.1 CHAT domain-containing tetratricopeptide repeat protein [Catalinimonas niigatensis]